MNGVLSATDKLFRKCIIIVNVLQLQKELLKDATVALVPLAKVVCPIREQKSRQ